MSSDILGRVLRTVSRAKFLLCDLSAILLLTLPAAAMLAFFVLRLCCERCRKAPRGWTVGLAAAALLLFGALVLVSGEDLAEKFALAFAVGAVYIGLYGLLFLPVRGKDARRARRAERRRRRLEKKRLCGVEGAEQESAAPAAPLPPPKVRCFSDEDRVTLEKDVRLEHVTSALERLKALPLGAGDRLEAQKMSDLLSVYRAKGELTGREADALNDVLAAVLKMMAKYEM